jgi:LacI family transcriptional regulator
MKKITIKEIAKITGVSSATVSRVLNDNGRFSEETRKKVLDAIEKFEYRPNVVAKSLRTSRSKTIGVIVPDITNEFFAHIVLAIENLCVPRGYSVFICNTSESEEKEKMYIKDLEAKGVDGLICLSGIMDVPADVTRQQIPVVCIDRKPNNQHVIMVESDNVTGGYLATEELIKKGCQKIVMLRDERGVSPMQNRYVGYLQALADYGLPLDKNLVINVQVDVFSAKRAITELIQAGVAFDGVFAGTDWLAFGALMALKEHHVQVPEQVKIVGFDNITVSQFSSPAITTIHQDKAKMGETAAKVLLDIIDNGLDHVKTRNITLPIELIRRETTG